MKSKTISLTIITMVLMFTVLATAEEKAIKGRLVELNSSDNSVVVEMEGKKGATEKVYMKFKVAKDARWHICLEPQCVITKGTEGFRVVNEYAQFEAYGLPHKSYDITLTQSGQEVTTLDVEIVPGKHKENK